MNNTLQLAYEQELVPHNRNDLAINNFNHKY